MSPLEPVEVPAALRGLRIAVLVAGGIAAYKVVDLVSQLVQAGCQVRVGMTSAATRFVGSATFHGVSGRPVQTDLWSEQGGAEPHVELGDWAQLVLVAPATADLLARVAHGHADDFVTATLLAARGPVVIAPAMNDAMWAKTAVGENLATLRRNGCLVAEPEAGRLASGHLGTGRLAGAASLVKVMADAVRARFDLSGRRVVVSAGGTREPLDPVRFMGNYSSGKMGYAMAVAAAERGAQVVLVSTADHPVHPGLKVVPVETAEAMLAALGNELNGADLLVMAAAVADFRPAERAIEKIRRENTTELLLRLEKNVDILAELAHHPSAHGVFRLGFAAEGHDMERRAREKLERKGLDAILANDIGREDIAFGSDHNAGLLLFRDGVCMEMEKATKREMADRILDAVVPRLP